MSFQQQFRDTHSYTQQKERTKLFGSTAPAALSSSFSPLSPPHSRPFILSAAGTRNKHHKGTFSAFTYEAAEALPARHRDVDHKGAPLQAHRGVTSLRRGCTEQGVGNSNAPAANRTMAGTKDWNWHPAPHGLGGSMRVQDNFRQRFEGLAGVQAKQRTLQRLHGKNGNFRHGARDYPELFDRAVRYNAADNSAEQKGASTGRLAGRVPHSLPFRGGAAPLGVGADRTFIGRHEQYPYHYSEYSLSEKSLVETRISNNTSSGFRAQCAHHIHFPMKATTARSSQPQSTDRNPNFHAIQASDETCRHRCNEEIAHARAALSRSHAEPLSLSSR